MDKAIPTVEEINILINNIYNIAKKVNYNLQINSLDEAAMFAANLYGFSSWAEFKKAHKKEYESYTESKFIVKIPKFKEKKIVNHTYELQKKYIQDNPKNFIYNLKESTSLPLEILVGKKKELMGKTYQPVGFLTESYLVDGMLEEEHDKFLNKNIEWLLEKKQCFFLFGKLSQNNINLLRDNDVKILSKNSYAIDPIKEALESDNLESIFSIASLDDSQNFNWLWINIVKILKDIYVWDTDALLKSLEIEFLLSLREDLLKHNEVIYKMLNQYLFKKCKINLENDGYVLSEESQVYHYHNIFLLKEKLEQIDNLYSKGYFSKKATINIKENVYNKVSTVFSDCSIDELKETYWEVCNTTFINALKDHNKDIKKFNPKIYSIWGIWFNISDIMNENIANEILMNNYCLNIGGYIIKENPPIENWYKEFKQILFLKNNIKEYSSTWLKRAFNNTSLWEENICFNQFACLRNLKDDEAYIWKPKSIMVIPGTEEYEFKKIKLYDTFIHKK
jgi:hypothetical protein